MRTRGVSFEDVVLAVGEEGSILDIFPHPNQEAYPHQIILVVRIKDYAYAVPFVADDEKVFLKTMYRSRKLNRVYLHNNQQL